MKGANWYYFTLLLVFSNINHINSQRVTPTNEVEVNKFYTVAWFVREDAADQTLWLNIILTIDGYDFSGWGTSGQDGLWLGFGIGNHDMYNTDMIMCEYKYHNSTNDAFICIDRWSTNLALPGVDSEDNIVTLAK